MPYPPAPWMLQGDGFLTLQFVDSMAARPFIPSPFEIVAVWPGRTLAGVCVVHYGPGSVLEYNELIVFPALVRYGDRLGAWVSHIYVDSADSVAGGREIWGLPKELAQFCREPGRFIVRQGERTLCTLRYGRKRRLWRPRFTLPAFGLQEHEALAFKGEIEADLGITDARWEIPPESPFSGLGLGMSRFTLYLDRLQMIVGAPHLLK